MDNIKVFRHILEKGGAFYGILLDEKKLSFFENYTELLTMWNQRMNLVSSRDMERFVEYHLLDSLKAASCFDMANVHNLLDFGSLLNLCNSILGKNFAAFL